MDRGSSYSIILQQEVERLALIYDGKNRPSLQGYGNGQTATIGVSSLPIEVDNIKVTMNAHVVPNYAQEMPILLGRNFTELPDIVIVKDDVALTFYQSKSTVLDTIEPVVTNKKVVLKIVEDFTLLPNHWGHIQVFSEDYEGDVYIEASTRHQEGQEYCIPQTVLTINNGIRSVLPCISLTDQEIHFKKNKIISRGHSCVEEEKTENVLTVREEFLKPLPLDDIVVGPIDKNQKQTLFNLLQEYRDCFSLTTSELGCSKTAKMEIALHEEKPFSYRPYRMARTEQNVVKDIVEELLSNNIVRESNSEYSSPVLLVKKKNGEQRMCVDYRKLNSLCVKDNQPLPRIDDQIDKLQAGNYFTSLDLKSGYHQVEIEESSKHYTAFVTPEGQYEYNRVPFGLTNAPRVFQ